MGRARFLFLATLMIPASLLCACGDAPPPPDASADAQHGDTRTADLEHFGQDQTEAYEIVPGVYQARGVGNTHMVVTSAGNVIVDAGLPFTADDHAALLRAVDDGPIHSVVVTHAHADHYGGASVWLEEDTALIAHREFSETQRYLTDLLPFLMRKNKVFYPDSVPSIPGWAMGALKRIYPQVEPTILVDDVHAFEVGGTRFEVIATPGAEGADSVSVWLPEQRVLFTGDFFGPIFPMVPNLYTIRGEKLRFAVPYLQSLDRIIALEPEVMVPSHFEEIRGADAIREALVRTRDAVQYIHDETVAGMNAGKDVFTLMREIRLPAELDLPESHGRVSWNVRAIWESYTGWFDFEDTTQLYAFPPSSVYAEVATMAGGAAALAARAQAHVAGGEPEQALHLAAMALAAEPGNRAALEARLAALELLLERSGGINHSEVFWLRHRISKTRNEITG